MVEESRGVIEIFYSYAPKDDKWRVELEKQLSILRHRGLISNWHSRKISPGVDWQKETDTHLNSSALILLLISPDFIASDYCYGIEMKRALERHEAGDVRVIPIILRPTDWKQTPFEFLTVLPANKKPVTSWQNRDAALLDVARGIREAIEDVEILARQHSVESVENNNGHNALAKELTERYCATLFERWKMLDFKGIMHVDMNRPISIPLIDVFVVPDVLVGMPEYETLDREDTYTGDMSDEDNDDYPDEPQHLEKRVTLLREDLYNILAKYQRLIFLGDPGSGKSTLLRYLLLQTVRENLAFMGKPHDGSADNLIIPLYLPLASYAEACLVNAPGTRSLKDFLPHYLRDNYLDEYSELVQIRLMQGRVLLLFDGLDEIPEAALRIKVVRQIELFTQKNPGNRFVVTSRIVGYKEAQLSAEYQAYTLADFDEKQIRVFTTRWCPVYEHWIKGTQDSEQLQEFAIKEAEKLFQATQRKPAVKRLAANPLLLTILALIQRQGIELPSHRIELFELCASTLLDTWIKAKELIESTHFSKNDLIKILRPLAFWMHEHPAVGAIPEEELIDQIAHQLLSRKITRHEDEASRLAQEFLVTVRGKTGILVERGKQRYGFLHLTFEEYFAAKELEKRKEREDFIKKHLHDARWREVILLMIGEIGILQSKEEEVTELIQDAILGAGSPYEEWIHRDLLFAGICLADDIGASNECEEDIIHQIIWLYLFSPYDSLRKDVLRVFNAWSDTKIAVKVMDLLKPTIPLLDLRKNSSNKQLIYQKSSLSGLSPFSKSLLIHYQNLIQTAQEAELKQLYLRFITILCTLHIDVQSWLDFVLALVHDPKLDIRQEVSRALGLLASKDASILDILLVLLSNHNWQIRHTAVKALDQSGTNDPRVIDALLKLLDDHDTDVRKAVIGALGQRGNHNSQVTETLLSLFKEADPSIVWSVANALGQIGAADLMVADTLLQFLGDPQADIRGAAARALGLMKINEPHVVNALLQLLANPGSGVIVREPDKSMGMNGYPTMNIAMQQKKGAMKRDEKDLIKAVVNYIKNSKLDLLRFDEESGYYAGSSYEAYFGSPPKENYFGPDIRHLWHNGRVPSLEDIIGTYWQMEEPLRIIRLLDVETHRVMGAYLQTDAFYPEIYKKMEPTTGYGSKFSSIEWRSDVTESSWQARLKRVLARLSYPRIPFFWRSDPWRSNPWRSNPVFYNISLVWIEDVEWLIRRASMLEWSMRYMHPELVSYVARCSWSVKPSFDSFLKGTTDFDAKVRQAAAEALGMVGSSNPHVVDVLLPLLSDVNATTRRVAIEALGLVGMGNSQIVQVLLPLLSDAIPEVKRAAVKALGQLGNGDLRVVEALRQQLPDADPITKRVIGSALGTLAIDRDIISQEVEVLLKNYFASSSNQVLDPYRELSISKDRDEEENRILNDYFWVRRLLLVENDGGMRNIALQSSRQTEDEHIDALLFVLQQLTNEMG